MGGKAFARGRYGPFHVRRTDRAQQDAFRDLATSAVRTVFGLCKRRLHGTAAGTSQLRGRPVTRYSLALGPAWGPQDHNDSPPPIFGQARMPGKDGLRPGPDEDTAHRLELDEREEPEKVSGEISVDRSGVIVKGSIKARFKVPEPQPHSGAALELEVTYELQPGAQPIEAPKDVLTMKLPHAVNDPLWFTASNAAAPAKEDEEDQDTGDEDTASPAPAKTAPARSAPGKTAPAKPAPAKPAPPRSTPAGR